MFKAKLDEAAAKFPAPAPPTPATPVTGASE